MATIFQFQKKLAKVANDAYFKKLALEQLKKVEDELVRLNKERLSDGEDLDGNPFGVYTEATQEFARNSVPPPRMDKTPGTRYNFEWTGGLFDGMYLMVSNDYVEIWSKDKKTPLLNIEYDGLFGLQEEQLRKVIRERVYPMIMEEIRKSLEI